MKAKLVRESINFERGIDPKEAMGLGLNAKVMNFLKWVRNDYQLDPKDSEYYGYINLSLSSFGDSPLREGFSIFVRDWKRYLGIMKKMGLYLYNEPDLDETIIYDEPSQGTGSAIEESQNFERTGNPYEDMRIGQTQVIPKDIDWDYDILDSLYYKFLSVYEFIPDWKGVPILVVRALDLEKNITGYYAVTNSGVGRTDFTILGPQRALENIKATLRRNGAIHESLNFERGKDPLDSMNIGLGSLLKEKAEKIEWDWYPDLSDEEKVLGLETWEGINKYNIKISRLRDKDGHTVYYAVADTGEPYFESPTFYESPEEALENEINFLKKFDAEQEEPYNDSSNDDFFGGK